MSVLNQIEDIVRQELGQDGVVLVPKTTARDVPGWDSLANIRIMAAIEHHFRVRFSMAEVTEIPNIGELVRTVASRTRP